MLSFDGPGCLERYTPTTHEPVVTDASSARSTATPSRRRSPLSGSAVQRFPNAMLLDLNDLVCPGGQCAAQNPDGLVVFRDSQHLTDSFVRTQVAKVIDRLKILGLGPLFAR